MAVNVVTGEANGQSNEDSQFREMFSSFLEFARGEETVRNKRSNIWDNASMVPVFTGDDPLLSYNSFREKFQQCAMYFRWSEEDKYFVIQQRLAGRAQVTFSNFKTQLKTSEDILKLLKDRFSPCRHPSEVLEDFWAFKQPASMPVADYIAQARQKVRVVSVAQGLPEELREEIENKWLLAMCLKNLATHIRKGVIARNPATLEELEGIALNEEKAWISTRNDSAFAESTQNHLVAAVQGESIASVRDRDINRLTDLVSNLTMQVSGMAGTIDLLLKNKGDQGHFESTRGEPGPSSVNTRGVTCYFCKKQGHIQRFCRLRQNQTQGISHQNRHSNVNNFSNSQPNFNSRENNVQNRGGSSRLRGRGNYSRNYQQNRGVTVNTGNVNSQANVSDSRNNAANLN